ncbi:MAG: 3-deoxy-manno-octulosonate cytidylyltransferase [Bacteroidales bacterium]|nr:3-deoxy-manno-octulosonate cytidylyltransferase [Bacteroidales bacterium]
MKILAIIPARYASSRFPGKPLAIVNGKPMIQRVFEQASKAFEYVCVATDDQRIFDAVTKFGGKAVMTSEKHNSGTDRCFEALQKYSEESGVSFDIVVNVQGDEPYIQPQQLKLLEECFSEADTDIATLVKRVKDKEEFLNPNAPKVITDHNFNALYFSRAAIPYPRDKEITDEYVASTKLYRHIGLYGYRSKILEKICAMDAGFLEQTEKLEQLRWLENGLKIKVAETDIETYAVDTPEDLESINRLFCQ